MYADIKYLELLKFKGCEDCVECCKKPMAPLVLEDFEKVYNYFPIMIAKLDQLKPVMLLSNDTSCPYLINSRCSIYDKRPPACKIYPYSPWYDSILLDLSCNAVGTEGEKLPLTQEEFKKSAFYEERFENINNKLHKTEKWINRIQKKYYKTYFGIDLFFIEGDDIFSEYAKTSLIHINKYF